jgi:hypothetical protein
VSNIFYDTEKVNLIGYKATPVNCKKSGMRKVDETSNAEIYKKGKEYFVKFK